MTARTPTTYAPTRGQGRGRGRRPSQYVRHVDDGKSDQSDNGDYVYSVSSTSSKQPTAEVIIQGMTMNMIIDSDSSVNILDEKQWLKIKIDHI